RLIGVRVPVPQALVVLRPEHLAYVGRIRASHFGHALVERLDRSRSPRLALRIVRRFRRNVANPEAQLRSVLWELERGRDEYVHVPFADQPRAHLRRSWQAHADHTRMARAHLGWLLVLDVREYAAIQPHLDG